MKHILCLCLSVLLCCLLCTGCKQQPDNFVQSAQLSQSEQELLQLLEIEQPQLFDFSVRGAKSLSLELFTLENGSWKPVGSFSGNIDQPSSTVRALPQLAAEGFLHPLPARLCAGKSAGNRKRCRTACHPHLFCAAARLIFVLHKLPNLEKSA